MCGVTRTEGRKASPLFPTIIDVEKGERLWVDMRFEQRVFVLRSGAFVCMAHGESDQELPFSIYGKGIAVGLAEIYIPRKASEYYHLRAITPGRVCSLPMKSVRHHLELMPPSYQQEVLSNVMTSQVTAMLSQVKMTSRQSYVERALFLLLRLYCLSDDIKKTRTIKITHSEIATLIGSDRVTATRALHKARDDEYIELGYTTVKLTDKLLSRSDIIKDVSAEFYPVEQDRENG